MQTDYIRKLEREKEQTAHLQKWTDRACGWFPLLADAMRMEKYCHSVGFTTEQTDRLFTFQPLEYNRSLYSEEHKKSLSITDVTAQIRIEQDEKGKRFVLRINGKNILDWFSDTAISTEKQWIQAVMAINTYVPI